MGSGRGRGAVGAPKNEPPPKPVPVPLLSPPLCPTAPASSVLLPESCASLLSGLRASSLSLRFHLRALEGAWPISTVDLLTGLPSSPGTLHPGVMVLPLPPPAPLQPQAPPFSSHTEQLAVGQTGCAFSCSWGFARAFPSTQNALPCILRLGLQSSKHPPAETRGEAAKQVPQRRLTFIGASRVPPWL